MPRIPAPHDWGTFKVEPFDEYRARWPTKYADVPDAVIESWIHRHWQQFQAWLPLHPLEWKYEVVTLTSQEVLTISHVGDWMTTLEYWGNDLLDDSHRKQTWLGKFLLEHGTTPAPMILAKNAGHWNHPRESGKRMQEPLQLVEGHLRLAYLQALIRRSYPAFQAIHQVVVATLPATAGRGDAPQADA